MKLKFLLILFGFMQVSTNTSAQQITLNKTNATLNETLQEIRKQSGYNLVADANLVKQADPVTIHLQKVSLDKALQESLAGQPFAYSITNHTIVIYAKDQPVIEQKPVQLIKVTGKVIDETGQPVTGKVIDETGQPVIDATIKIKDNTQGGTVTDINGLFSINAPDNAVLVVSFIGYETQEITTNGSTPLNISLKPAPKTLNDVVVIGYGTQRKRDVTGAVTSVSAKTLQEVPQQANVADQLQGRVAGLDIATSNTAPGSVGQIRLRGERSFATSSTSADATNGPLFVLDGVPFINGNLNDINPNDILSIEVLKDASATAIYGSRASGGVILVSTKRGKSGRTNVNLISTTGVSNPVGDYKVMDAAQYVAFKNEAAAGNTISPGTSAYGLTVTETANLAAGVNTNWLKLLQRTGLTTDNQLQISGGNDKTQFSLSGGYRTDKGIQYAQFFNRGSFQFSLDHTISNVFKVGLTSNNNLSRTQIIGSGGTGTSVSAPYAFTYILSPLLSPYNADGSVNVRPWTGYIDELSRMNPLTLRNTYIQDLSRRIVTNNVVYGEANILDGLKYRVNASLSYNQTQLNNYYPANTLLNTNTLATQSTAGVSNNENYVALLEHIINYDKTFGGKHHIAFTGLFSTEKDHSQGSGITGAGVPADYLQSYNLFLANSTSVTSSSFSYAERGMISYMARGFYGFNDKYLFTATVRRDGSSVLGPGHQYLTYPAFAFGWNADREDFIKPLTWISTLKFRAGYGVTADQNVAPYQILGNLSANATSLGTSLLNGYLVTTLANNQLQFEHTNNINLGLDFGLFNNRITGSIDVYTQKTYNVLQVQSLPISNGSFNTTINAGNSKGRGLEISLSSRNIDKVFKWSTDFNIAFQRSSITSLHDGLQQDIGNGWFVGQPFNVIYDYKKIGIWQTDEATQAAKYNEKPGQIKIEDVNNDGKIDANDRQILGSYQPNYTAGLTNRFFYKGLDLILVTFARMGQKVSVNYLANAEGFFNSSRVNQYAVNYWTPTNPTNDFPRPDASQSTLYTSTLQYQDGSFIKMRSISLGYSLPAKWLSKAALKSLRLSATVNNPFNIYAPLVSNGLGIDPESNARGGQAAGASGFSGNALGRALTINITVPQTRIWSFGINAGF